MGWLVRKCKGGIKCLKENGVRYTIRHIFEKLHGQSKKVHKKLRGLIEKLSVNINKLFRKMSVRFSLGFLEFIHVRTYVRDENFGKTVYVYFCGKQVYPGKKRVYTNHWVDPEQPVMYFKINRSSDYSKPCVQHWVNIAYQMHADYYFICDNKQLEMYLLRTVTFPGGDIKFMPSMRGELDGMCSTLCRPGWKNATLAHLTPFYHAKQMGKEKFWAIDADDMMICLKHSRAAALLNRVQEKADNEGIEAISVDIWRSRSLGRHWSWGVAYVNSAGHFRKLFEANPDMSWITPYLETDSNFNLDWFMSYLKDTSKARIESFYAENMYLIHWLNFLRSPLSGSLYFWHEGKIIFPIMRYVFCYERLGIIDIADPLKIDFDIEQEEGLFFLENEVCTLKDLGEKTRGLNNVQDFSSKKNTIEDL